MLKQTAALLTILSLSLSAGAATVNMKNSSFKYSGTKKIGEGHMGNISLKSADVSLDKSGKLEKGTFVMNMSSITVDNLDGKWAKKYLDHMKSADFFDVKKYPTSQLVLTKQVDNNTVKGDLTIKGKTQPVIIDFTESDGVYSGTLTFDRTKFGIVYGSGNFVKELAADKIINNDVTLDFKVTVERPNVTASK